MIVKHIIINGTINEYYTITEDAQVFNDKGLLMKQHMTNNGYMRVKLSKGVKRGMYLVHRLVAETYINNPLNLPLVDHVDTNRRNNNVINLQWCDNSFNQKKRYEVHKGTKCKPVAQVDPITNYIIEVFESPIVAEQVVKVARQNISKVCTGQRNQAGGYFWKYL